MAISLISLDEIRLLGRGSRVMTSYLSSLNLNQQKRRFLLVDFPTLHFFWVPFVYSKVLQFCFFFPFSSLSDFLWLPPTSATEFPSPIPRKATPHGSPTSPLSSRTLPNFSFFFFLWIRLFFYCPVFCWSLTFFPLFFYVGSSSVSSFLTKAPSHVATLPRLAYSFYWVFTGFSFQLEFQVRCSAKKKIFFFCFRKRLYWLLLGFQSIFLIKKKYYLLLILLDSSLALIIYFVYCTWITVFLVNLLFRNPLFFVFFRKF